MNLLPVTMTVYYILYVYNGEIALKTYGAEYIIIILFLILDPQGPLSKDLPSFETSAEHVLPFPCLKVDREACKVDTKTGNNGGKGDGLKLWSRCPNSRMTFERSQVMHQVDASPWRSASTARNARTCHFWGLVNRSPVPCSPVPDFGSCYFRAILGCRGLG